MAGEIFLLLGSNKGNRLEYLSIALGKIESTIGQIIKRSSIYETASWGNENHASFLNQVIEIKSAHSPEIILTKLLHIETGLGRKRTEKWGPREIDLDILLCGHQVINTPDLIVPHPAIAIRRFTLIPLIEIAPLFIHPITQKTFMQLLDECQDHLEVSKLL